MKNSKINRLDAPKGYVATPIIADKTKEDICTGCAFIKDTGCGLERNCNAGERKDKQDVIFIKETLDITH